MPSTAAPSRTERLRPIFMLAPAFIVVADLTRLVSAGSVTGTAAITGILAIAVTWLAVAPTSDHSPPLQWSAPLVTLVAWWGWCLVVAALVNINFVGLQNLATFTVLAMGAVAVARRFRPEHVPAFTVWMNRSVWVLAAANGLQVVVLKSPNFYGSRTTALVALIAISWLAPRAAKAGHAPTWALVAVFLAELGLSQSRTALAIGLALCAASLIARDGRLGRSFLLAGAAGYGFFYLSTRWAPIRDRFAFGDGGFQIGGFTLNTEGRAAIWQYLWDSINGSNWWIGQGIGTAPELVIERTPLIGQPHNDYLRALVDQGVVGVALLTCALLLLGLKALRLATVDEEHRTIHVSALLSVISLMVAMLTDNSMVYVFVLAPTAVLIGASLGLGRYAPARAEVRLAPSSVVIITFLLAGGVSFLLLAGR